MGGMVQSLDPAEMACWRAFIESSQLLMTRLEDDLRDTSELTFADYHVLVLLSEAPQQRLRMGELASKLIFSPSRLTYHIGTMERRGLVVPGAVSGRPPGQPGGPDRHRAAGAA